MKNPSKAILLSAPASNSGKTVLTLGILRALHHKNHPVRSAKSGPDYIDPCYHSAASGNVCVNLDAWAMNSGDIIRRASGCEDLGQDLIIEGAMGLFDGAPPDGAGSSADLARILGVPVVLIIDASAQSQSIAAVVAGFAGFDANVRIGGVILNKVGSARHETMLRHAIAPLGIPVLGAVMRTQGLALPARHLGLVQAGEHPALDAFLNAAAQLVADCVDLEALCAMMSPLPPNPMTTASTTPKFNPKFTPKFNPPVQTIAIAHDVAFGFTYPHILADWRARGATIHLFSPLANEPPPPADMIILPGGYPELHAGRLAANTRFMDGIRNANTPVYGECGGYMVMGRGLIDADGLRHAMAGLLDLETSFATPTRHLGYRRLGLLGDGVWRAVADGFMAHEFHYASTISAVGDPLFTATTADGTALPPMGLQNGAHCGSFAHIIDICPSGG